MKLKDVKDLVSNIDIGQMLIIDTPSGLYRATYIRLTPTTFGWLDKDNNLMDNNGSSNSGRYSIFGNNEIVDRIMYAIKNDKSLNSITASTEILDANDLTRQCIMKSRI